VNYRERAEQLAAAHSHDREFAVRAIERALREAAAEGRKEAASIARAAVAMRWNDSVAGEQLERIILDTEDPHAWMRLDQRIREGRDG
jgi:hypothetical protein